MTKKAYFSLVFSVILSIQSLSAFGDSPTTELPGTLAPLISQVTVTQPLSCVGNAEVEVSASGGVMPYEYSLDGGLSYNAMSGATAVITGLQAGVYDVFVRDTNQEVSSTNFVINAIQPITITATSTNSTCNGATDGSINASAQGGTGVYFFQLMDMQGNALAGPQASGFFSNLSYGQFVLEVVDDGGCVAQNILELQEPELLTATATTENVTSPGGNDGSIVLQVIGGTPPYEVAVNQNNQYSPLGSGELLNLTAGLYTLYIRDANGCEMTTTATLTEPEPEALAITAVVLNQIACGANASVLLNPTGGVPPYAYSSDGSTFGTNNAFAIDAPGSITFTVRDANGATAISNTVVITAESDAVAANLRTSYDCNGVELPRVTFELANGSGTIEYSLYPDVWQSEPEFLDVPDGQYSARVRNEGCEFETTITVANVTPVQVRVAEQNEAWVRFEILNGEGPFNYRIDDYGSPRVSVGNERFFEIDDFTPGPHWLVVEGANCSDHVSFDIEGFIPELEIVVETTHSTCHGSGDGSIQVSGIGGLGSYNYGLVDGDNTILYPVRPEISHFENLAPGTYQALLRDVTLGQLVRSESITITEPDSLQVEIEGVVPTTEGTNEGSITLKALGGTAPYRYAISGRDLQDSNSFGEVPAGTYEVEIQDSKGCTVRSSVVVETVAKEEDTSDEGIDMKVFQNPGHTETLDLQWEQEPEAVTQILIYNGKGTLIYSEELEGEQAQTQVNVSNLSRGIYFVHVKSGGREEVKKVLIL